MSVAPAAAASLQQQWQLPNLTDTFARIRQIANSIRSGSAVVPLGAALEVARAQTALDLVARIVSRRKAEFLSWLSLFDSLSPKPRRSISPDGHRGVASGLCLAELHRAIELVNTAFERKDDHKSRAGQSSRAHTELAPWSEPLPTVAVHALQQHVVDASTGAPVDTTSTKSSGGARRAAGHGGYAPNDHAVRSSTHACLPLIASECPGWVCFAEKTSPQAIPYLAATRSPQQVLGLGLMRSGQAYGRDDSAMDPAIVRTIYHVSIQPCFDKKLEGSRLDFYHAASSSAGEAPTAEGSPQGAAEVDCVLSTGELFELAKELEVSEVGDRAGVTHRGDSLVSLGATAGASTIKATTTGQDDATSKPEIDTSLASRSPLSSLLAALTSPMSVEGVAAAPEWDKVASGGYAEHAARFAACALAVGLGLTGLDEAAMSVAGPLDWTRGRNGDMWEAALTVPGSDVGSLGDTQIEPITIRVCTAYGFRNIQGVISRLRKQSRAAARAVAGQIDSGARGILDPPVLDFVEAMACPSGCANGGGQVKVTKEHADSTVVGERNGTGVSQSERASAIVAAMKHCVVDTVSRKLSMASCDCDGAAAPAGEAHVVYSTLQSLGASEAATMLLKHVGGTAGGLDGTPLGTQFHRVPPMVSEVAGSAVRW